MAISSHDADKFRLKHAEELLALFEEARGRPARTTDELARWLDSVDDDPAQMTLCVMWRRKWGVRPGGKPQRKTAGKPTKKRAIGLMNGPTNGCLKASEGLVGKIIPD